MAISAIIVGGLAAGGFFAEKSITDAQQKKSDESAQAQLAAQQNILNEANRKQKAEQEGKDKTALDIQARDQAKSRQAALAAIAGGRGGTILTGPLGLTDQPTVANKTLLGA